MIEGKTVNCLKVGTGWSINRTTEVWRGTHLRLNQQCTRSTQTSQEPSPCVKKVFRWKWLQELLGECLGKKIRRSYQAAGASAVLISLARHQFWRHGYFLKQWRGTPNFLEGFAHDCKQLIVILKHHLFTLPHCLCKSKIIVNKNNSQKRKGNEKKERSTIPSYVCKQFSESFIVEDCPVTD